MPVCNEEGIFLLQKQFKTIQSNSRATFVIPVLRAAETSSLATRCYRPVRWAVFQPSPAHTDSHPPGTAHPLLPELCSCCHPCSSSGLLCCICCLSLCSPCETHGVGEESEPTAVLWPHGCWTDSERTAEWIQGRMRRGGGRWIHSWHRGWDIHSHNKNGRQNSSCKSYNFISNYPRFPFILLLCWKFTLLAEYRQFKIKCTISKHIYI